MAFSPKLLQQGAAGGKSKDAQFNYVTMLLHGDGTNGAQNNTFLDSSTNAFTITRNGNTTQGSFSPYGSNWSNYLDGSGDYLTAPDNTAFNFGSGSFTIEMWIYPTGTSLGTLYSKATADFNGVIVAINNGATGRISFYADSTGSTPWEVQLDSTTNVSLNAWSHIACVRNSNTWTIYINGAASGTTTSSITPTNQAVGPSIGFFYSGLPANYQGYVSNLRVVKGTAVYTSAFTPSTTPLTAISGTSLLTCQSNRFIDNSTNAFAITVNGNPSVQRFNPFGASTAYSTAVIGGSGYFDGSGDYLNTSANATQFGTGNFTIEFWIYFNAVNNGTTKFIFDMRNGSATSASFLAQEASDNWTFWNGAGTSISSGFTSSTFKVSNWTHVAISRSSGVTKFFINGTQTNSVADTSNYATSTLAFGARYTGSDFLNAYVSDLRLVKGTALYTASFTPPTAPLTAVTNTSLLLNMTNGAIFDNAMMNDLETVGNAQISTSVVKYGTGSLYFDGTGDYLKNATSPVITLSGNFTIECWLYINSTAVAQPIISFGTSGSTSNLLFLYNTSVGLRWYFSSGTIDINQGSTSGWATGTWYHVAAVRSGSTLTLYRNGTSIASGTTTQTYQTNAQLNIGGSPGDSVYLDGYIDDFRITNGYARYTSNFTAPTAAFSDTGPY